MMDPSQPPNPPPLPPPLSKGVSNTLPEQLSAALHSAVSSAFSKVMGSTATLTMDMVAQPDDAVQSSTTETREIDAPPGALVFYRHHNAVLAGVASQCYSDFVIEFRFPLKPVLQNQRRMLSPKSLVSGSSDLTADLRKEYQKHVEISFVNVMSRLRGAGLEVETRQLEYGRLFLFVTCPARRIKREALKARVHDFLAGVRGAHLNFQTDDADEMDPSEIFREPLTTSERLRLVHQIIVGDLDQGGAAIVPLEVEFIDSVFPLHDRRLNKEWLKKWSLKWNLDNDDLKQMRDQYGEKVAYYFAFLQFYFHWLIVPAAVGFLFYITGAYFNLVHGFFNVIWSILFVASWRRRERKLAVLWDVRETSRVDHPRPGFRPEAVVIDPVTKERVPYYPLWKRYLRRAITFPLLGAIGILLMALVGTIFAFEVFITEFYHGPGLAVLIYSPTVVYCALVPFASAMYFKLARHLNGFENHETEREDEASFTQKIFVFNFLVSFLSVFLTAYVYVPFSGDFENWLRRDAQVSTRHTVVRHDRIVGQLIYFVLTGQMINFGTEFIVPFLSRFAQRKIKILASSLFTAKLSSKVTKLTSTAEKDSTTLPSSDSELNSPTSSADMVGFDAGEKKFLKQVRSEANKPVYDMYEDFAEMITQFGYVSMFSVGWPLIPLVCLVNNWVEVRSDAVKICVHTRRPIPRRTDTIGPWLDNLDRLSCLGSITNVTLSIMYRDYDPPSNQLPPLAYLLVATLLAENAFFVIKYMTERALAKFPSRIDAIIRKSEYELKRKYIPNARSLQYSISSSSGLAASADGLDTSLQGLEAGLLEIQRAFKTS